MNRKDAENDRRQYDNLANDFIKGKLSRRDFLKRIGMLGSGLALIGPATALLASCTPAATTAPTTAATMASVATADVNKTWPLTNATTAQLLDFYKNTLPFTGELALPDGPVGTKPLVIGFSQTGFNHPWRVEMIRAAQAEVARHPNVSLVITDGNVDINKQNSDVDDLLAQNVDAVVMSPVESAGLVPAGNKVMAAKKPLVLLDRDIPSEKTVFIGQSNITMAKAVGDYMVKKLNGKGQILEITGLIGSSPAIDRQKGMKQALEAAPDIKILATGDGQWIRDPAKKLMDDWLVAFPKIDAVFSHAEESSYGAQLAIAGANRCGDKILHFTHDSSNGGFKSVQNGEFAADGNYTPFIGDIGVRAALMALLGQDIPKKQTYEFAGWLYRLPDSPVITADNVAQWLGKGWGTQVDPDPCATS
jgi:ribose transport system substrate-binding protein